MSRKWLVTTLAFVLMLLLAADAQARREATQQDVQPWVDIFMSHDDEYENGDDDDDDGDNGIGFGKKVAGAWLAAGSFSVDLGCNGEFEIGPIPFLDTHTFGLGGDHVVTNPANPNSNLGTWKKTGPMQLTSTGISFGVDATPGGTVTSVAVITLVVDFDPGFQTATTTFSADVFQPDQDPLDPSEVAGVCTSGQHDSFRKVNVAD